MKSLVIKTVAAFSFAVLALNSHADQGGGMKMDMGSSTGMSMAMNEGEVTAIDEANKSITLKHGPIKSKNVEMPPMTMTFPAQHPSLLSGVKVGDRVKFTIEKVKDQPTVTALKAQK